MESTMSWMEPEKFVDMYLAGRSKKTFPTYVPEDMDAWGRDWEAPFLVVRYGFCWTSSLVE